MRDENSEGRGERRRRRKPEEARALILAAAKELLAELGPDAIGPNEVARKAGVSRSLVLHYFGTFEELIEEVFKEHLKAVREEILGQMAQSTGGPKEWVERLFAALSHPLYGRLLSWSLLAQRIRSAHFFAHREQGMKAVVTFLEERYRQLHGEPPFTREDLELGLLVTVSAAFGYTVARRVLWAGLGKEPTPERDRWFASRLAGLIEETLLKRGRGAGDKES